jgi:hypothetical protein
MEGHRKCNGKEILGVKVDIKQRIFFRENARKTDEITPSFQN